MTYNVTYLRIFRTSLIFCFSLVLSSSSQSWRQPALLLCKDKDSTFLWNTGNLLLSHTPPPHPRCGWKRTSFSHRSDLCVFWYNSTSVGQNCLRLTHVSLQSWLSIIHFLSVFSGFHFYKQHTCIPFTLVCAFFMKHPHCNTHPVTIWTVIDCARIQSL